MQSLNTEDLRNFALAFRSTFFKCKKNTLPHNLRYFPSGACGDASLLLAEYLKEKGFSPIYFVSGSKGEQSHAWLEYDGIIVDITADQFEGITDPAIVTRDRSWHRQFIKRTEKPFESDINFYDDNTKKRLWDTYKMLISYLA